jgi:hypothetical protein
MKRWQRRLWFYGGLSVLIAGFAVYTTDMPGVRYSAALPVASPEVRQLSASLRAHVVALAETVGERRVNHGPSLEKARNYLSEFAGELARNGRFAVRLEDVGSDGSHAQNVVLDLPGRSTDLIVVGAHYDSAVGSPGADDNASGVASTLELARLLGSQRFETSLRFVLFANEEPPYFQNPGMGSIAHARACRQRGETIAAMLSLESIGYFSDAPGSQRYPWPVGLLYPDRGDFVAFVGNLPSRSLVRRAIGSFRAGVQFPSEGAALPAGIPGVGWSDHWSFWESGYPAVMVTGTAVYRNPNYHHGSDRVATVDYERLARVTLGLRRVIEDLAVRKH